MTTGAIPFDRYGHYAAACAGSPGGVGEICTRYSAASLWYWPAALVMAYMAAGWFYLRRSRRRGVGTATGPYLVAGAIFALLVASVSLWAARHPAMQVQVLGLHVRPGTSLAGIGYRLVSASSAIGLALLLLARLERSWVVARPSPWSFLPHLVIDACVLMVGAAAIGLAQHATARAAL